VRARERASERVNERETWRVSCVAEEEHREYEIGWTNEQSVFCFLLLLLLLRSRLPALSDAPACSQKRKCIVSSRWRDSLSLSLSPPLISCLSVFMPSPMVSQTRGTHSKSNSGHCECPEFGDPGVILVQRKRSRCKECVCFQTEMVDTDTFVHRGWVLHARLALRLRLQLFGMELLRVMVRTFGDAGSAWVDAAVWSSDCVVFVWGGWGGSRGQGVCGCMCAITPSH